VKLSIYGVPEGFIITFKRKEMGELGNEMLHLHFNFVLQVVVVYISIIIMILLERIILIGKGEKPLK